MTDDELGTDAANAGVHEPYVAPAIEVLGSVEDLTLGPDPGAGDVPTGVISF
ncbi:MAG: hypothetical protein QOG42_2133 [Solirubrobacteraceae bacterium]|nr:hypothetical protein [Solirubrobacteraceae bacterium]